MALSYLPDAFAAQDIVQDVFTRVWTNRSGLPAVRNLEAWLITVTRNLLINALRKQYPVGWQPSVASAEGDPHKILDYRELEALLNKAVSRLSPRQQEVYFLSRTEHLAHKEIAARLGISVDVSREHLSKALHNIRAFLQEEYGPIGILALLLMPS